MSEDDAIKDLEGILQKGAEGIYEELPVTLDYPTYCVLRSVIASEYTTDLAKAALRRNSPDFVSTETEGWLAVLHKKFDLYKGIEKINEEQLSVTLMFSRDDVDRLSGLLDDSPLPEQGYLRYDEKHTTTKEYVRTNLHEGYTNSKNQNK